MVRPRQVKLVLPKQDQNLERFSNEEGMRKCVSSSCIENSCSCS